MTRREWYVQLAGEEFGRLARGNISDAPSYEPSVQFAYEEARLAAHFGRLALGESQNAERTEGRAWRFVCGWPEHNEESR